MGALNERLKLSQMVYGKDIVDYYKNNTEYMLYLYQNSSDECVLIDKSEIQVGGFYHFFYMDDSNWMKYSPVFICDHREFKNMIVLLGVNFNFIPLELRVRIFDEFITDEDFNTDKLLQVDFVGMYQQLLRIGFEYSIREYNVAQIVGVHRISLELLPRFLYSSYPSNKYDPNKLMDTWKKKIETKEQRHREIIQSVISDFYDITGEISENYKVLSGHIADLQKSYMKYGR